MKFRPRSATWVAGLTTLAAVLAACGGDDSDDGGDGSDGGEASTEVGPAWILGTTDVPTSLDPAGAYDLPSWTLQYNLYQTLMTIPAGENVPAGDAAEECAYDDPKTYTCTLKDGLAFSNGSELTSSDVKFSIDRLVALEDPNGASGLFASLASVETPDDATVTFKLSRPDTTFQFVLTTAAASIVDEEVFPADKLIDDAGVIGSGPFKLDQYQPEDQAVLSVNEEYAGDHPAQSEQVFVSYFADSSALKVAAEQNEVDVAWRSLSPTDINDLASSDSVDVIEGEGAEIRYFVWQLANPMAKEKAVRQAVAQLIDREAIAERAYQGTVDPLYSIVPPGFPGQVDTFEQTYGQPDVNAAKALLEDAGMQTPVELTLGYTPTHYGPNAVDEATELADQLNASGLFDVTLDSAEWEQYQNLYKEGAYDLFHLGWFPDFLDADNYLSPFVVDGGFYANNYSNPQANELVAQEQGTEDATEREEAFGQLQEIVAEDVPLIPSWVGKNTAIAAPGMSGVEETLDPAFIFRFWTISKEG
jgi:peptide/nickel transport system substrate-binding protein